MTKPLERSLIICKPDAVERGLVGEITRRFEAKGLRLVAADLRTIDRATAEVHYAQHRDAPFFGSLIEFMTGGPAFVAVIEGPEGTVAMVRRLMGDTDARQAPPGTIRGDLAASKSENLVHGSDSTESATREIALFYPHLPQ
ncbi:MAG: nucleoside-diphosphate kinase [Acidimicrobiales bacterium]